MRRKWTMLCLLAALAVPAAGHEDGGGIEVETLAKTGESWNGDALPAYPAGAAEITVLRIRIPAGTRLPLHKHPVINAGVLLRGELAVETPAGETLHLSAGDSIVELVGKWHAGRNTGDGPAEIVVFYAGTPDTPITIKAPADAAAVTTGNPATADAR
ncbi:cupin domain-containing protein [Salinisphaera sp. PC39]|uniref:cupin domain-containing protein n=1 Tax=Salinisphaera sp. PC39 TaxID=1304156 RepID=UPI00333F105C